MQRSEHCDASAFRVLNTAADRRGSALVSERGCPLQPQERLKGCLILRGQFAVPQGPVAMIDLWTSWAVLPMDDAHVSVVVLAWKLRAAAEHSQLCADSERAIRLCCT